VILTYCESLETVDSAGVHIFSAEISSILSMCINDNRYANELYLQLIKMTTDPIASTSKESLQCWGLMSIAVGVVAPKSQQILDYLKVYLKK
jgi:hypothetical protein